MTTEKKFASASKELRKKYGRLTFGRFLSSWRAADELTQVEFAKRLGLTPANLCDIERGRRIPSPTRAKNIAKKLGLPEMGLVKMVIEDALHKEGFNYTVELTEVA